MKGLLASSASKVQISDSCWLGKYKLRKRDKWIESYLAGRWLRRHVKVMVVGGMKRPACSWLAIHFTADGPMLSNSSDLLTAISFLLCSFPSPF